MLLHRSHGIVQRFRISSVNKRMTEFSVLVIDDDDDIRNAISRILTKCDCTVDQASSVEAALEALEKQPYDVVFSDMRFKTNLDGEYLLNKVTQAYPKTDIVLMSCAMDATQTSALLSQGAAYCLQKPFFRDKCLDVLATLKPHFNNAA